MRRRLSLCVALALAAACSQSPEVSDPVEGAVLQPPRSAAAAATVIVIGDFGVGGARERAVATTIRDHAVTSPLDALVTTGDNIYPSGNERAFENAWRRPYGWLERGGIPIIASLGNHDVRTAGGVPVMELFDMPARWYSRRVGPMEFIVLDANRPGDAAQVEFLERAIAASTATWQVAVFHQPAYSCGKHGSTPEVQRRWVPFFERLGVELVLAGHDHSYQRFSPINGVVYVVSGGGGAPLTGIGRCPRGTPRPAASFVGHHFVVLDATTQRLDVTMIPAVAEAAGDTTRLTSVLPGPTVPVSPTASGGTG